jgi:hypothetical protein
MACPEFLKPRLRLFLSADIVGSTALKQSRGHGSTEELKHRSHWFSIIQGFYIESQREFIGRWTTKSQEHANQPELFGEAPTLWKTIGDEVLFVKVLDDHRQLAIALKCWTDAVQHLKSFVKARDPRLDIKATAWTAGFPVKNKEVVIGSSTEFETGEIDNFFLESGRLLDAHYESKGKKSDIEVDYIGPSIDIGFRIAGQASPRKFIIGVDVAYILALTSPRQDDLIDEFSVRYGGALPLKGVFGGVDYPIFWLDLSQPNSLSRLEDTLTGSGSSSRDDVRRYCDAFYREFDNYTHRPFIKADLEQHIADFPPWYIEVHDNMVANYNAEKNPGEEPDDGDSVEGSEQALKIDEVTKIIVGELAKTSEEDTAPLIEK